MGGMQASQKRRMLIDIIAPLSRFPHLGPWNLGPAASLHRVFTQTFRAEQAAVPP
jgi:hypothetical protein